MLQCTQINFEIDEILFISKDTNRNMLSHSSEKILMLNLILRLRISVIYGLIY